jgi:hypothetical protein
MSDTKTTIPELEGLKSWRMWLSATVIMVTAVALPAVIEAWKF